MSKPKFTQWVTLIILLSTQVTVLADRTITFESGQLGPIKIVTGGWMVESGKLLETSDLTDKRNRPLFATIEKEDTDNTMLSIDFEVYDGSGHVYVCPAWQDPNNYTAVIWADKGTVQIVSVTNNKLTVQAEKKVEDAEPPLKLGAAVSGNGIRAYVNDKMVLEAAVIFKKCKTSAIGAHKRNFSISKVEEKKVRPWNSEKASLCPIRITTDEMSRLVFFRMEENGEITFILRNQTDETLPAVKIKMNVPNILQLEKTFNDIAPKKSVEFKFPVPAGRLRPDDYQLNIHGEVEGFKDFDENFTFTIVNRPNPERMTVMNWGGIPVQGAKKLSDMGFTHAMNGFAEYEHIFENPNMKTAMRNKEYLKEQLRANEECMKAGIYTGMNLNIGHRLNKLEELCRVKKDGSKVYHSSHGYPIMCPLLPKAQELSKRVAELIAKTFGQHPAFVFANINSEVRGGARPCYHKEDIEAYKKATGLDYPEGELEPLGMSYKEIKDFPENRIVPDDHPLLTLFSWFWKEGDGWVKINDIIYDTLKENCHKNFFCWHDPAVRAGAVYGSGGKIEIIGQWTYTNPDPIRIGMNADELLNMAEGKHKTYQNVQAIWYKSRVTAKEKLEKDKGTFDPAVDTDPEGRFLTPSPAQFTEAFWVALSRPVDMIGTHGINSLLAGNGGSYAATNPATAEAFAKLNNKLTKPFGPMLKKISNRPADAAFLESFASHVFARRGSYGWVNNGCWIACQYAGLQPDIIFEETIVEKGLGQYKVLILSYCDVLTQSVYDKIVEFQRKGGIIIGDENLVPGIKPDILMNEIKVKEQPDGREYKKATIAAAMELRRKLSDKYNYFASSTNPDVVLHTRENDYVQYIFAINDHRTFGSYVGHYGMVMEDGLPSKTTITVQRSGVKVFDLLAGKEVVCESDGRSIRFDAEFEPAGGKIYVVGMEDPAKLNITAPQKVKRGQSIKFNIEVFNKNNEPASAVLPIKFEISDPEFRQAEPTGFYAAEKGKTQISFDIAENDMTGVWTIKAQELMTGLSKTIYLEVE